MLANSKPAKKRKDGTNWIFKRTGKAMDFLSSSQSNKPQHNFSISLPLIFSQLEKRIFKQDVPTPRHHPPHPRPSTQNTPRAEENVEMDTSDSESTF
jgi:hypothetical protein